jgi:hypothetical protein
VRCLSLRRINQIHLASNRRWGLAVDILLVLGGLIVALMAAGWSSARSYFESGRRQGIEEAIREMARGVTSHCQLEGGALPPAVEKAIAGVRAAAHGPRGGRGRRRTKSTDPSHAQLWILGNAIGEACWLKGHGAGVRRKAPAEGKIRVDLSVTELLQLGWLAHLGFQHMMPNYRGFESYRFSGEDDAQEGARAVSRIEAAIPAKARPVADLSINYKSRVKLIAEWWQAPPDRLSA